MKTGFSCGKVKKVWVRDRVWMRSTFQVSKFQGFKVWWVALLVRREVKISRVSASVVPTFENREGRRTHCVGVTADSGVGHPPNVSTRRADTNAVARLPRHPRPRPTGQ